MTDAWYPQPNGVVRVSGTVADRLKKMGHEVPVLSPDMFLTFPCPTYSELRLAWLPDAFVFPSLTDTFGLVMLEAFACGIPVAAYPVTGLLDVIGDTGVGVLNEDLRQAALDAVGIDLGKCCEHALRHSWDLVADEFLSFLAPLVSRA